MIAIVFPTQGKRTRYINLQEIACTLCFTCIPPSVFQFFDLKHLLLKTFFQRNFFGSVAFIRSYSLILVTCAFSI